VIGHVAVEHVVAVVVADGEASPAGIEAEKPRVPRFVVPNAILPAPWPFVVIAPTLMPPTTTS
jgi:hypothetical protein